MLTHDSAETKGTGGLLLVLGWSELSRSLRSSGQICIVLREKPWAHLPVLTPATLDKWLTSWRFSLSWVLTSLSVF